MGCCSNERGGKKPETNRTTKFLYACTKYCSACSYIASNVQEGLLPASHVAFETFLDRRKPGCQGGLLFGVVGEGPVHYKDMYNRVNIDEKWFYQASDSKNYILTAAEFENENDGEGEGGGVEEDEATPHRTIRHKSHIPKAMFLCAQAQPRWDPHRNAIWDGKIGLWPIGNWAPAQRTSI
jgi:hypothetical protein